MYVSVYVCVCVCCAGGIRSKMSDFFLASNHRLKDPAFAEAVSLTDVSALNKFGVLAESSGRIRVRLGLGCSPCLFLPSRPVVILT